VIVGQRRKLNKDFSYDSYLGLLNGISWKIIKIPDNSLNITGEGHHVRGFPGQGFDALFFPFLMKGIG